MQHQDLLHLWTREGNITVTIALTQIWSNMQVKNHIESFPAQESHYSRSDNHGRLFLSENLSIHRMYHLYLEIFEPEQYERIQQGLPFSGKVKEHFYR